MSVFAGLFSACQNDDEILDVVAQQEVKFAISVGDKPGYGESTRANAAGWEDGDKIYAFFDVENETDRDTRQVEMTYDAATSTWKAEKKAGEWEFNASGSFDCVSFKAASWTFKDNYLSDGTNNIYGFLLANDVAYTYNSTTKTVTANITFENLINDVKFVVSGLADGVLPYMWLGCYEEGTYGNELYMPTELWYDYENKKFSKSNKYTPLGTNFFSYVNEGNVFYARFNNANTKDLVVRLRHYMYNRIWDKKFSGKTLKAKSEIRITAPASFMTGEVGAVDNGWTRVQ